MKERTVDRVCNAAEWNVAAIKTVLRASLGSYLNCYANITLYSGFIIIIFYLIEVTIFIKWTIFFFTFIMKSYKN